MSDAVTRRVRVGDPAGLHARPCAALAKLVGRARDATLTLRARGGAADAASILELLGLVVAGGEEVVLEARGPGAAPLLDAAARLLADPAPAP